MDKAKLKQILYNQFEPVDTAAQKKLAYLKSDEVFSSQDYMQQDSTDLLSDESLMNAFNASISASSNSTQYQLPEQEARQYMQSTPQPKHAITPSSPEEIAAHKQNIAAKIAALRGISLPGDYIHGK